MGFENAPFKIPFKTLENNFRIYVIIIFIAIIVSSENCVSSETLENNLRIYIIIIFIAIIISSENSLSFKTLERNNLK